MNEQPEGGIIPSMSAGEAPPTPPAPAVPTPAAPPSEPAAPVAPTAPVPEAPAASIAAPPAPPAPSGPLPAAVPTVDDPAPAQQKLMDLDWPFLGYTGPQPWEAENPPTLTQNHLMLSSGSSGPEVVELAALLGYLGYATSVSSGENPHAIYDAGVSKAVEAFCAAYGVREDPQVLAARTPDTVGPWLWEAIVRAVHKKAAAAERS